MTDFRKIVSSIAGALILGLTLLLATPAQALPGQTTPVTSQSAPIVALTGLTPTCSGDNCSGKDPMATNCAEGAYTIDSHVQGLGGGIVELRYSPTCQTNWARWTKYPTGWCLNCGIVALRAVQDTGYTQTKDLTNASLKDGQTVYTPMIYSPVRKVRAEIVNICGSAGLVGAAFDCLTNGIESTRSL